MILTCEERDEILQSPEYNGWEVAASLTDLTGEFGAPRVETTWYKDGRYIKDIRRPSTNQSHDDLEPCKHYDVTKKWEKDNG